MNYKKFYTLFFVSPFSVLCAMENKMDLNLDRSNGVLNTSSKLFAAAPTKIKEIINESANVVEWECLSDGTVTTRPGELMVTPAPKSQEYNYSFIKPTITNPWQWKHKRQEYNKVYGNGLHGCLAASSDLSAAVFAGNKEKFASIINTMEEKQLIFRDARGYTELFKAIIALEFYINKRYVGLGSCVDEEEFVELIGGISNVGQIIDNIYDCIKLLVHKNKSILKVKTLKDTNYRDAFFKSDISPSKFAKLLGLKETEILLKSLKQSN